MSAVPYSDYTPDDENSLADARNRSMGIRRRNSRPQSGDVKMDDAPEEEYKLQNSLKPSRTTTYSTQALYGLFCHFI
jgi:hypothetical protein